MWSVWKCVSTASSSRSSKASSRRKVQVEVVGYRVNEQTLAARARTDQIRERAGLSVYQLPKSILS
jgi:hypothetical protein